MCSKIVAIRARIERGNYIERSVLVNLDMLLLAVLQLTESPISVP